MKVAEMDKFLEDLLTFESGIDPRQARNYAAGFDVPSIVYWEVRAPGKLIRDGVSGAYLSSRISYQEYFRRLGVPMRKDDLSPDRLAAARFSVTNPWMFVGYQIGEAILIDTGYYEPEKAVWRDRNGHRCELMSFYVGDVPEEAWVGEIDRILYRPHNRSQPILATRSNLWQGKFTGKSGVFCFADLLDPVRQVAVIKNILQYNLTKLEGLIQYNGGSPRSLITERSITQSISLSGCLAACHLAGVRGVFEFLTIGRDRGDETGTLISNYMRRFSGYDIGPWLKAAAWRS